MLKPRVTQLRINGKKNMFEKCPLESELIDFTHLALSRGAKIETYIQEECSLIIKTLTLEVRIPDGIYSQRYYRCWYMSQHRGYDRFMQGRWKR